MRLLLFLNKTVIRFNTRRCDWRTKSTQTCVYFGVFQYPKVRLKGGRPFSFVGIANVSIPEGAIEGGELGRYPLSHLGFNTRRCDWRSLKFASSSLLTLFSFNTRRCDWRRASWQKRGRLLKGFNTRRCDWRSKTLKTLFWNTGVSIPEGAIEGLLKEHESKEYLSFNTRRCDWRNHVFRLPKRKKIVSIPEGAIEGVEKHYTRLTKSGFQYPKVRLKVKNWLTSYAVRLVSIPEGAIEGRKAYNQLALALLGFNTRRCDWRLVRGTTFVAKPMRVSIPEGAIEGLVFVRQHVAEPKQFQYPKVRLKATCINRIVSWF